MVVPVVMNQGLHHLINHVYVILKILFGISLIKLMNPLKWNQVLQIFREGELRVITWFDILNLAFRHIPLFVLTLIFILDYGAGTTFVALWCSSYFMLIFGHFLRARYNVIRFMSNQNQPVDVINPLEVNPLVVNPLAVQPIQRTQNIKPQQPMQPMQQMQNMEPQQPQQPMQPNPYGEGVPTYE